MKRYIFKKAIAFGIMGVGIYVGILTQPITENPRGVARMMFMLVCGCSSLIYNGILDGRWERHGRV